MTFSQRSRSVVTGAKKPGRATAHLFAQEGALVAVTDVNEAGVGAVVEEIRIDGGTAHGWRLDVFDSDQIKDVVAQVANRFGRLDILINNAGFGAFRRIDEDGYDAVWDRALGGLLTAQQLLVRAALPHLRKSDAARIVNIASTEGLGATPGDSPMSQKRRSSASPARWRWTWVQALPQIAFAGPIRTPLTSDIPDEHKTIFGKRRTALKRYGYPEEVAHITFSLCLPAASYITGAVVPVDGGLTIRNA